MEMVFLILFLSIRPVFSSTIFLDKSSLLDDDFDTSFNFTDNSLRSNAEDVHDNQVNTVRMYLVFGYLGLMCLVGYVCCGCGCFCPVPAKSKTPSRCTVEWWKITILTCPTIVYVRILNSEFWILQCNKFPPYPVLKSSRIPPTRLNCYRVLCCNNIYFE